MSIQELELRKKERKKGRRVSIVTKKSLMTSNLQSAMQLQHTWSQVLKLHCLKAHRFVILILLPNVKRIKDMVNQVKKIQLKVNILFIKRKWYGGEMYKTFRWEHLSTAGVFGLDKSGKWRAVLNTVTNI
jgi:hypothetical protein